MPKDLGVPYLLMANTFGVVGVSGLANGRPDVPSFETLAEVFMWLRFSAGNAARTDASASSSTGSSPAHRRAAWCRWVGWRVRGRTNCTQSKP